MKRSYQRYRPTREQCAAGGRKSGQIRGREFHEAAEGRARLDAIIALRHVIDADALIQLSQLLATGHLDAWLRTIQAEPYRRGHNAGYNAGRRQAPREGAPA